MQGEAISRLTMSCHRASRAEAHLRSEDAGSIEGWLTSNERDVAHLIRTMRARCLISLWAIRENSKVIA